jgi:uncharacterized protein YaiI (UPF0178 family)
MRIWVDADACPKLIKEIIFRAAIRSKTMTILVANQPLQTPKSPYIQTIQVSSGFDVADSRIIEELESNDLVITADIPLADAVIKKGGSAIDPRGKLYTSDNIKQTLSIRNLNAELRGAGMLTGGPPTLGVKDTQAFANSLDRFLAKR